MKFLIFFFLNRQLAVIKSVSVTETDERQKTKPENGQKSNNENPLLFKLLMEL